ncbi:PREDICTED: ankyrin repeat and SOCS box protein 18 [Myotis davidii]|uniref:ankyrin repeat and SOCS box protein 18 n=1 Tax=Myotis davidii TaxID=225400 RepID=UPI0003EBD806|nr:PREDICTED: ankyrin repeat and SOCS box protein 18 [Myotis davidii]
MSSSDCLPDHPLSSDLVRRLKSALDTRDEETVRTVICTQVRHVDAVIELANDDWMKDPSAQLPPGVLLGLWTLEYTRELTTPLCIAAARGHAACVSHLLGRGADPEADFPQVLQTCAPAPAVIEVLFNAYPQLRVSESWREVIPEEVFQAHRPFYRSLLALAGSPRRLLHLCRCAIRRRLGKHCFRLVPLLPLPATLQSYLLLEPEGVLH